MAHFLLVRLLEGILEATTGLVEQGEGQNKKGAAVRVCWTASLYVEMGLPAKVIDFADLKQKGKGDGGLSQRERYSVSKTANLFLAEEFARRKGAKSGVLHVVSVVLLHAHPAKTEIFHVHTYRLGFFNTWRASSTDNSDSR